MDRGQRIKKTLFHRSAQCTQLAQCTQYTVEILDRHQAVEHTAERIKTAFALSGMLRLYIERMDNLLWSRERGLSGGDFRPIE